MAGQFRPQMRGIKLNVDAVSLDLQDRQREVVWRLGLFFAFSPTSYLASLGARGMIGVRPRVALRNDRGHRLAMLVSLTMLGGRSIKTFVIVTFARYAPACSSVPLHPN